MAKIALVKQLDNSFKAAFDSDYEYIKKLKQGEIYFWEVKRERNIMFHRKFFALIQMVYQNQEHYNSFDKLRKDLLIDSGYFEEHTSIWGEVIRDAQSISFASMDQDTFDKMYSDVLDNIVKHFHFDKQDIIDNVEQYF
jgi:hypothetical protein